MLTLLSFRNRWLIAAFILTLSGITALNGASQEPPPDCPYTACDIEYNVCVLVDIDAMCKDAKAGEPCTGSEFCSTVE